MTVVDVAVGSLRISRYDPVSSYLSEYVPSVPKLFLSDSSYGEILGTENF